MAAEETYRRALLEEAERSDLSDDRRKANAAELRRLGLDAAPAPVVETADAPAPEETAVAPKPRRGRKPAEG